MAFLKPQSPIKDKNTGNYIYPLTTADQVVMPDGSRLNSVFKHTVKKEVTLLASGWSSNVPYTQAVTVDEYVDNLQVDANVVYSKDVTFDAELNVAASCLSYIKKEGKVITFYCLKRKPKINIPIEITYENINSIVNLTVQEGIALNFEVVGGKEPPTNKTENMIWVNTDVEISEWIFSTMEPRKPSKNMVWITTSLYSNVEFNALKNNSVQVYPLSAKQYINDTWVGLDAKTWQAGEWVIWNTIPEFTYTGDYEIVDDSDNLISISAKDWKVRFLTSGTLRFTDLKSAKYGIDVFLVGGGGGGAGGFGGGGGYTTTVKSISVEQNRDYVINVGSGGAASSSSTGYGGSASTAFEKTAKGAEPANGAEYGAGGNGGCGGGGWTAATSSQGLEGKGGCGGTDGSNGTGTRTVGKGQGTTTREFGESNAKRYAGGGGAGGSSGSRGEGGGETGGRGGTGDAGNTIHGHVNTGGGGGGGGNKGNGGSGIVIIRNKR